jgi:hypothetical protein
MRARTVGAGAGFAGDRIEPAVALAGSGRCDAVVLECLAERTLVRGLTERRSDPAGGFDPRLRRRLAPLLEPAWGNRCPVVTNLGSANPLAAAEEIVALAGELGLHGLRVAAVTGDDLASRPSSISWEDPAEAPLLGAHAYLGAAAIQDALEDGADVVVTGRVADASLFVGPLASMLVDDDALAGATTVGHLLECAAQLTGGNLDPPRDAASSRGLHVAADPDVGYPFATVLPDGSATLAKLPATGGRLDDLTCALQLLYEVHDPRAYATPDAIIDLSGVDLEVVGPDEVAVSGAGFVGVPDRLKVIGFVARPGAIADLEIAYAGSAALGRAHAAAEILRSRLEGVPELEASQVDLVGVDSVLRGASRPLAGEPPEVRVHVSVRVGSEEAAHTVEDEVFGLTLTGPAGGCGIRSERRERIESVTGWIDRGDVTATVTRRDVA